MVDTETGVPHTAHTTNQVPLIITDKTIKELRNDGNLADITPTILEMMQIEKPFSMTGVSMILK
jgi:2,3-bisphosphoglycerate-independent phosphoglycerate mutase